MRHFPGDTFLDGWIDGCAVSEAALVAEHAFPAFETISMLAYSWCATQSRPGLPILADTSPISPGHRAL
jgi:hypothetical protein